MVYFRYPQTNERWVNTVSNPVPVLGIVDQNVTMYTARPPYSPFPCMSGMGGDFTGGIKVFLPLCG